MLTVEWRRFSSAILPAWCRKSPKISEVSPLLYLHGLSSQDFAPSLESFLGTGAGLSAAVVTRLTVGWQVGEGVRQPRSVERGLRVCVGGRGAPERAPGRGQLCLLVMIGVRVDDTKELKHRPVTQREECALPVRRRS